MSYQDMVVLNMLQQKATSVGVTNQQILGQILAQNYEDYINDE